ncbi:hypothetical protein GCM10010412_041090 [Nonomuraea recticatena]|uniref:Uncharacterized protein n=1 Tax=Nonomuraea recticatena TaxID=46178 RepID=A0ABP6EHQ7_9ACTN
MGIIISVRSTFGHQFTPKGDGLQECDWCGGTWRIEAEPDQEGSEYLVGHYETWNGDDPSSCPGTSRMHGEAPCQVGRDGNRCEAAQEGPCQHTQHGCNCLYCTG